MRTFNQLGFHGFSNIWLYSQFPIDIVGRLESIINSPQLAVASSGLSYREEIKLLESALAVLTHIQIPLGTITLDPSQNDKLVATGFVNN